MAGAVGKNRNRNFRTLGTEGRTKNSRPGVSNLLVSLGYTGRRVVLDHMLNTQTLMKTDEQKKKRVLSKFTILFWVAFIASLGCTWPTGRRSEHPC